MSVLLKIVEGPNKGAEIALVEGVVVTLGKRDDCDIVLADSTLPDTPISISTQDDVVSIDGETLEPFVMKTLGATSFAVGPADAPWGELKRESIEKKEEATENGENGEQKDPASEPSNDQTVKPSDQSSQPGEQPSNDQTGKPSKRRRGCLGCLVALFAILLFLAGLGWFYWDRIKESDFVKDSNLQAKISSLSSLSSFSRFSRSSSQPSATNRVTLADVASKYGLSLVEADGVSRLSGDLKTRRERLAATAEAYAVLPGVELDLSDDETFRTSAEDALFTLTEGALKLSSATNRILSISGVSASPAALKQTIEALSSDLPKMRDVDLRRVVFNAQTGFKMAETGPMTSDEKKPSRVSHRASKKQSGLPVCGILTVPYPCLVLRDGRRVFKGASIDGGVIVDIGADTVTLTNSTGRYTWKP